MLLELFTNLTVKLGIVKVIGLNDLVLLAALVWQWTYTVDIQGTNIDTEGLEVHRSLPPHAHG